MSFAALAAALLLGIRHALEPDHMIAVTTLLASERRLWRAVGAGLWWGLGHGLALTAVGLPLALVGNTLPARLADSLEGVAALLIIALGLWTAYGYLRGRVHSHPHRHGSEVHTHFHSHRDHPEHGHHHEHAVPGALRSLGVGIAHGLAGSGAAVLLAAGAAGTPGGVAVFFALFNLGVVAGMTGVALALAIPATAAAVRWPALHRAAGVASGVACMGVGALMIAGLAG